MPDSTRNSDVILADARRSLAENRAGGYHRRASIGRGSADLKTRHLVGKLKRIALAVGGIVVAAMVAGLIVDGIGFAGVMVALLAIVAAVFVFSAFPKMKVPKRAELNKGDTREMVGRTELWLEHQRPALPPPAAKIVDDLGVQLDALGLQLETVDQAHPAVRDVRQLVGEHLPEMIDSYRKVPAHLRGEKRAGATPDEQLAEGLGRISREIDSVTRQLADGALDDLAVRHRYLDYRYGEGATKDEG
ncbi:O-antigen ligase family protein [Pelagerythrobacter rhizovicinus]|uniref:Uncharacterized protein n=1 Tax=Pelagerythrobacter rhizovicinus TaxID=2268576 RepID=A0A4Q2KIP5_9SPHN|nr:O-antigen ligase family protein [Pelagerythrobacter rhizovicinus]RXZ64209.1 hypothetical protein ETX26_09860 [Pelagerythrobacter rhizovicinus]